MKDWKLFLECGNGHRFGIEVICPDCDQVVAEHLHNVDVPLGAKPLRLSWWQFWRESRRLRKEADRFDWGSGNDTSHHGY